MSTAKSAFKINTTMKTISIIISCGARASDTRQVLVSAGVACEVRKILPNEKIGDYGDYLFRNVPMEHAILIATKHPGFVRGLTS